LENVYIKLNLTFWFEFNYNILYSISQYFNCVKIIIFHFYRFDVCVTTIIIYNNYWFTIWKLENILKPFDQYSLIIWYKYELIKVLCIFMVHGKLVTLILGDFPFHIFDRYVIIMQIPKLNFDSLFKVRIFFLCWPRKIISYRQLETGKMYGKNKMCTVGIGYEQTLQTRLWFIFQTSGF